jgi:hypothetical protein
VFLLSSFRVLRSVLIFILGRLRVFAAVLAWGVWEKEKEKKRRDYFLFLISRFLSAERSGFSGRASVVSDAQDSSNKFFYTHRIVSSPSWCTPARHTIEPKKRLPPSL